MDTPTVTYGQILNLTQRLEPAEQLQLLEALAQSLRHSLRTPRPHSILELQGLGKEVWQNIDVGAYINQERDTWDG